MDTASDVAERLKDRTGALKSGSLCVSGDVFGGRIDNVHVIVSAEAEDDDCLVLEFDGGETLRVWSPHGVVATEEEFRIQDASRVRWEWYYYGRNQTPENRFYIEHVRADGSIMVNTDAVWAPKAFSPSSKRPAVELLG